MEGADKEGGGGEKETSRDRGKQERGSGMEGERNRGVNAMPVGEDA